MSGDANEARNPRSSVWVSANAGSGKTHLLADRVTRLLLAGADPGKILCLTYTKAAAAEMSSRLFERLGVWALLDDTELRARLAEIGTSDFTRDALRKARRLFAQALETPGGLKIQTIHSFCQHVLTRFPVEARVPPGFAILDERTAADLMRMSREDVLARANGGDERLEKAITVLATRTADGRFAEIVDAAIAKAGRLRAILAQDEDDLERFSSRLRQSLAIEPEVDSDDVIAAFCGALGRERGELETIAHWLGQGSANDKKSAAFLNQFLADLSSANFDFCRKLFLTGNGELRKSLATKASVDANPQLHDRLQALCARTLAVIERAKSAATATLTEAIVTVSKNVLDKYDALKAGRAALDYDDLTRATLALLEREDAAAWVLYKLDGGIDHILVDEAQDTSPEQWRIVGKLAEEFYAGIGSGEGERIRTLFAVGDEKQSIFSFQGAAPEEFGRNLAHFRKKSRDAELSFAEVRLPVSRRSTRSVLSFVDAVFSDDAARDGLSASGEAPMHEPHRKDIGRIEIWPTVKPPQTTERDPWNLPVDAPSPSGADMALAAKIADRIAGWIKERVPISSEPGAKAIDPGDIMILVRRRNAFAQEMIRQLMDRGVRVAGADRMVLLDQIVIADLMALGRFALLPEDELNLAALLKSPLVGFSEDDLYDLAQPRSGQLWNELARRSAEGARFSEAYAFLSSVLADADFMPPFEFFAKILSNGARKTMLSRFGAEADDAIGEFLTLAQKYEDAHPPSLEGFLDWFSRGAAEVKRDMEQAGSAVRVMTVHGAKGLEASIVIVPDTAQAPDHERRAGILYTDDCLYFGMSKAEEPAAVTRAKADAHLREMREYRRLLYVALTRARDRLVLCGYETKHGVQDGSWYPFLEGAGKRMGREEITADGETIIVYGEEIGAGVSPPATADLTSEETSPGFLFAPPLDAPPERRIIRPFDAYGEEEPAARSPLSDEQEIRFGRGLLIHALLAMLPEIPLNERTRAAERYLALRDIPDDVRPEIITEVLAVLDHPDFAALFGENSRGEISITCELPEIGPGLRVSGQIDRLALQGSEVLIADFKTNRPPPKTAEQTPRVYVAQLALYRAALARIYPGKSVACVLVWTDGPSLMRVPESLLDDEFQRIKARSAVSGTA